MIMRVWYLWLMAACFALAASPASGQMMPGGGPGPGGRQEDIGRRVEEVKISRLTEALKLDEKTAARFIPAVTSLDQLRRKMMGEHRQYLFELRRQMEAQRPYQSALAGIIEKLRRN